MNAVHAFVYNGNGDWKLSIPDDWELDVVEIFGDEKTLGHHKIDGSICKIIKVSDGKIAAISK